MDSWLVFRTDSVILNQWTKHNDRSIKWFSKTSFVWSLSIRQEILNVSQIGFTFHRICPPIFIQTWLQQYHKCPFSHSAHCSQLSHLFPICVVLTYNDSRKDLHRLCQIPRNCQYKWLYTSHSAPRSFARSFVFPEKFLSCTETTGSIGWLSPAPRLHIGDCFEIRNCHWGTLWSAVIKSPCTRDGSANASSAWGPCNFGPFTDLAISVFRKMSINTVLTQILTSLCSRL